MLELRLPRSIRVAGALIAPILSTSGCLVPPSAVVRTTQGEVRAPSPELATRAASYVERTREELERRIPGLRDVSADVWIQKKAYAGALLWFRAGSLHAFTLESANLQNPRIHVPIETYESSITHELVHALLGPDWDALPAVIEEGLCDVMSVELARDSQRRLNLLISATLGPDLVAAGKVDPGQADILHLLEARESLDLHQNGPEYAAYAYGVGYVLVERIRERFGLEYLHQLALRARNNRRETIPAPWLLDAAAVAADRPLLERIEHDIDLAFFEHLVASGELVRVIEGLAREGVLDASTLDGVIITYAAEAFGERGLQRRLVELPGFQAWARENRELLPRP